MGIEQHGPILVIEDEERVSSFVEKSLREAGFNVVASSTAESAEKAWLSGAPRLVILDLMLPDRDGIDLLTSMRERRFQTPVLVLSAKSSTSDRVSGLDQGADDYLGKPFGIEELLARVRVLLRRPITEPAMQIGGLTIDLAARRVSRGERVIFLSETEFRLVELLASSGRRPVSKREILAQVWSDPDRDENVVEVYISYLRSKLEWGNAPRLIHTVRGKGYVLDERGLDA